MFLMKVMTSLNCPGRYIVSFPGPRSVNPVLASKANDVRAIRTETGGTRIKSRFKTDGCKNPLRAIEFTSSLIIDVRGSGRIVLRKSPTKSNKEMLHPAIKVFHGYLLVCSIDVTFV